MFTFIIGVSEESPSKRVMAISKSPFLPTIPLRGPVSEAMLQGNRILLTSETRLIPLTCMS